MDRRIFIQLATAAAGVALCGGARANEVLRAAYEDSEQPPYYMGTGPDPDPSLPGVSVEMLREAGREAGIDIQFTRMPWVRCQKSLERGEVDLIFNASFKPDRMKLGVYPMVDGKPDPARRIDTIAYALYRPKGGAAAFDGKTVTGLDGGPVAAPAGYSILGDLKAMGVATETAPDTVTNFRKLASGRIPATAALERIGDGLLADFPQIEKVTPLLATKDYFVMASHQSFETRRATIERLWAKLAEVRDGAGSRIYARYAK
ncbi:MAG: transporter substrate-binding domain-containing protein [Pseudomonadota bacterium]